MTKWQTEMLWKLYDLTNRLGGAYDFTAVSQKTLAKKVKCYALVSSIIYHIITKEDKKQCEKLFNKLYYYTHYHYPDKNGNLTDEEKRLNEKLHDWMINNL